MKKSDMSCDVVDTETPLQLRLPTNPTLGVGVSAHLDERCLCIQAGSRTVVVEGSSQYLHSLLRYLNGDVRDESLFSSGNQLNTSEVMTSLVLNGMLAESTNPPTDRACCGLTFLGQLWNTIDTVSDDLIERHAVFCAILDGTAPMGLVHRWLLETFHFTRHAAWHIAPVLTHEMAAPERLAWTTFLREESSHWRIYVPIFRELGWSMQECMARTPLEGTMAFIGCLRRLASASPHHYAAAMTFIEQAPDADSVHADPLYGSLLQHYGFSETALRPLWWHACENLRSGHSDLGLRVLSQVPVLSCDTQRSILLGVNDIISATAGWYDAIGENYL